MKNEQQRLVERIRSVEQMRERSLPRYSDGFGPYFRESLAPRNPLSHGSQVRVAQPVGDNEVMVIFSTVGF